MAMDDDDDVEILSINEHSGDVFCEICHVSLTKQSVDERQLHYEEHFDQIPDKSNAGPSRVIDLSSSEEYTRGESPFVTPKKSKTAREAGGTRTPPLPKQNVFWYQSQDSPPPSNFTPGLIPTLKQALLTSHSKGRTMRAALCYAGTVHIATELWDLGWGCGYRNFLMACTALMDQQVQPLYFPALDQPSSPGVRNLQQWIEDAWRAGFDPEGAADLKGKLVGTRKWIGTAELHVAFLSRGIPSCLVDFPHVESGATAVLDWIVSYFSEPSRDASNMRVKAKVKTTVDEALRGASPVVVTDRMPLVLQHKGHSRTIVGYERTKDGSINLLCFDPARSPSSLIRNSALQRFNSSRTQQESSANVPTTSERHHNLSPSKILNTVLHPRSHKDRELSPHHTLSGRKRGSDENGGRYSKRPRGGLRSPRAISSPNDEVIQISDEDDDIVEVDSEPVSDATSSKNPPKTSGPELDYTKVLESFRLRPKKVGKNDRYQILYFPLEDILTDEERWRRRIVTSEVIR
ncbi:hypothetical protein ACEPAH_4958 [Sanghuangporus vaninii]